MTLHTRPQLYCDPASLSSLSDVNVNIILTIVAALVSNVISYRRQYYYGSIDINSQLRRAFSQLVNQLKKILKEYGSATWVKRRCQTALSNGVVKRRSQTA